MSCYKFENPSPCFYCGRIPKVSTVHRFDKSGQLTKEFNYYVQCENRNCSVKPRTAVHLTSQEAIKEWNNL